ncbi:tetratricopeptide repeat-containing sensor histidine kinase [Dyadobacter tibetensis]|uniref:tetratricopeptide repeat-containing sensor histidine kinase n=1 Tax=Dyadobacter tibetensis TaxID=1211851 RepID=UPI0004BC8A33|nr:tetratricopeptide repeat protein [Dyadobacter tibetensis]
MFLHINERWYNFLWLAVCCTWFVFPTQAQNIQETVSYDKGLTASTSTGVFRKDTLLIHEYNRLARKYLYQDAAVAIRYAKEALALCQKNDWDEGKLQTYNVLSSFYVSEGGYDFLRELANESYTLAVKKNLPLERAYAERFLAETYTEYKDFDKAYYYFESALKTFNLYKADSAKALCMESIANHFREKGEVIKAKSMYDQTFQLYERLGNDYGKATCLQAEGYMYLRHEDYARAEEYFHRSRKLYEKVNLRYGLMSIWNDLSNLYVHMNDQDKAIETGLKALELSKKYHSPLQITWALAALAQAYKQKGDLKSTIECLEQTHFNRRLMHQERIERQFTMSQLMFDNKKKDLEIQQKIIDQQRVVQIFLICTLLLIIIFALFLWRANINLRHKNAEIRTSLIKGQTLERKRVAAELHDSLGGTLASLNWYLYGIDKKMLPEHERTIYNSVQQMVGKAYKELRSLSHNLMPDELDAHGLVLTVQRLVDKLNENNEIAFNFQVEGLEDRLDGKVEFEMYSIILELTTNILKHANAKNAVISIKSSKNKLHLQISDDGIGLTKQPTGGMGLGNVRSRVESLMGDLKITNDKGTIITITIPHAPKSKQQ